MDINGYRWFFRVPIIEPLVNSLTIETPFGIDSGRFFLVESMESPRKICHGNHMEPLDITSV